MSPAVALLNYISCGILWWIFLSNWDISRGFSLYIIDMAGCTRTPPYCVFSWVFSIYYLPERSAKLRCERRRSGDIIFHSIGRREIIIVYLEYQSVCPIVGIGPPPTPSSESECVSPLDPKGGQHSLAGEWVGDPSRTTGYTVLRARIICLRPGHK